MVDVSVILPAKDEAATIGDVLARLHAALAGAPHGTHEVVVVDDGSGDGTADATCEGGAKGTGFYGAGLVDALEAVTP